MPRVNTDRVSGFTIVELLIVVVIIAILAAITVVAFNGVQDRARNAQVVSDLNQLNKKIQMYAVENGSYPSTGGLNTIYVDNNCAKTTVNKRADWVPGITGIMQNPGLGSTGVNRSGGCYMYSSDGVSYVLSAWNARSGKPGNEALYRRLGYREVSFFSSNSYLCNHVNIGGNSTGTYNINNDYYKYSYTISNLTNCNETPPVGA